MSTFIDRDASSTSSGGGTITGAFIRTGVLSVTLPAGETNNYTDPSLSAVSILRINTNVAGSSLTGIVPPAAGTQLSLINIGPAGDLTLSDSSGSSTAANQFEFGLLGDIIVPYGDAVDIWYDPSQSRWVKI